jgi:multidrug efflux pump subunit AcrA (membrane-fusion protein)
MVPAVIADRFHEAFIGVVLPDDPTPIEPRSEARLEVVFVTVGQSLERGDRIARLRGALVFDIFAPFAGYVVERCASPGQISGPGRPVVRMSRPNQREVRFAVPNANAAALGISPGLPVTVALLPGDRQAPGTILQIAADGHADSDVSYAIAAVEVSPDVGSWIATGRVVYVFPAPCHGSVQ